MHILDQQNFIDTRQKFFGRADAMPNVSFEVIDSSGNASSLKDDFDAAKAEGQTVLLHQTDPKTNKRVTREIKVLPMGK